MKTESNIKNENNLIQKNNLDQVNKVVETPAEPSFLQSAATFMDEGGVFMWIILGMWMFALSISLERVKALLMFDINANKLMNLIKKDVLQNNVQSAINSCLNSKSIVASVLKNGLKRANQSKEQIQDALDASIMEAIPKVEKRLPYLALLANISTLIGLLGTIYGLIQSFGAVASADPSQKAQLLALGISKAMNTTALGLISAITIMCIHSILTSKSDKIVADMDEYSLKLVDLLGSKKNSPQPQMAPEAVAQKKDAA